jgi:hypothetical protein
LQFSSGLTPTFVYHCTSWLSRLASTVVLNFPFSVTIQARQVSRAPHLFTMGGKAERRTLRPSATVGKAQTSQVCIQPVCTVFTYSLLARPTPTRKPQSGAKYPIHWHLASLQCPQNLRKPMESSVPSRPVVILILKTNFTTKTLASLNNPEQGPRLCGL